MKLRKKKRYAGILGEPRKFNPVFDKYEFGVGLSDEASAKIMMQQDELDVEMLLLLLDHYEIDREDDHKWFKLSYELALDHIPGFRYEKAPRGRNLKWTPEIKQMLVYMVNDRKKERPDLSYTAICGHLAKRNIFPSDNPANVYARYNEAKKTIK